MSKTKRLILLLTAVLALQGIFLGAYWFYGVIFPAPRIFTSSSPAGLYSVTVTGQSKRPSFPGVVHSVWFTVVKDKKPFLGNRYLHSGDWLDPSFAILYPQHAWFSENVLHFYREEYFQRGRPCTAVVTNNSGQTIRYLKVTSDDTYLLFDLQPGSSTKLTISPPRGSNTYISVDGEFSEQMRIEKTGENFSIHKKIDEPITYYINIVGTVPSIESPHLEKFRTQ